MEATDYAPNDLWGKAPPRQKTHLPSPRLTAVGRLAKPFAPDFEGAIEFGCLQRLQRRLKLLGREIVGAQFVPDAGRTESLGTAADNALDKALV